MPAKPINKKAVVLLPLMVAVFNVFILLFPREMTEAARGGVSLWFNGVLPALLPFVVGANLLMALGAVSFIGVLLNPIMRPLFGVPGSGAFAFLVGVMSGNPVGAKVTCELREGGAVTRTEGQRLLAFASNCGPLFILGTVAAVMLGNMAAGWFIMAVHVAGAVVTGLMFKNYGVVPFSNKLCTGNSPNLTDRRELPVPDLIENGIEKRAEKRFDCTGVDSNAELYLGQPPKTSISPDFTAAKQLDAAIPPPQNLLEVGFSEVALDENILKAAFNAMLETRRKDSRGFGQLLAQSVMQAMQTLLLIGGFIVVFGVISAALSLAGVFAWLAGLVAGVMPVSAELPEGVFIGVLEMANGAAVISAQSGCHDVHGSVRPVLLALIGVVSWGGLCVHAQAAGYIAKTDLSFGVYLFAKVVHVVVAVVIGFVMYPFFGGAIENGAAVAAGAFGGNALQVFVRSAVFFGCAAVFVAGVVILAWVVGLVKGKKCGKRL